MGRREFESFCASFPFDIVVLFVLVNRAFILEMFLDHNLTSRKNPPSEHLLEKCLFEVVLKYDDDDDDDDDRYYQIQFFKKRFKLPR